MTTRTRRPSLVARIRAVGGIVVALVNPKGGSGKSTAAWHLAHEYAARGLRVLLLDTDSQQTQCDTEARRKRPKVVTVMPYPHASVWEDFAHLAAGFDVVIIDGQARHDRITRAVMAAGIQHPHGVALVPIKAASNDVAAARRDMAPLVADARANLAGGDLGRVRTCLVDFDLREIATREAINGLAAINLAEPTRYGLTRSTTYTSAAGEGLGACEYAHASTAAADVAALATEVAELALSPKTATPA